MILSFRVKHYKIEIIIAWYHLLPNSTALGISDQNISYRVFMLENLVINNT